MDRHEAGYVLVVDDDADVRTMIERVLGRAGFRVLTAQDGEAALQILRGEQRIDVVLTDLQMPRMSGVALLRSIRELDQDVPVIVLTGNASLESAIAVVEPGGFDTSRSRSKTSACRRWFARRPPCTGWHC